MLRTAILIIVLVCQPRSGHAAWELVPPPVEIPHPYYDLDGYRALADDGSHLICIYRNLNLTVLARRIGGVWQDIDSWWSGSFGGALARNVEANSSYIYVSVFSGDDVGNNSTSLQRYGPAGVAEVVDACSETSFNPACPPVNDFFKSGDAVFPDRGITSYRWFDGSLVRSTSLRTTACGAPGYGAASVLAAGRLTTGAAGGSALFFGDINFASCQPANGLVHLEVATGQITAPTSPVVSELRGLIPWDGMLVGTGVIDGVGQGLVAWTGSAWVLMAPFTWTDNIAEVQLLQGTIFIGGNLTVPGLGDVPYAAWRNGWFPTVPGLPGPVQDFAFADGSVYARVRDEVYRKELSVSAFHLSLELIDGSGSTLSWTRAALPVEGAVLLRDGAPVHRWGPELPVHGSLPIQRPFGEEERVYTLEVEVGGVIHRSDPVVVRGGIGLLSRITQVLPNPMRAGSRVQIAFQAATPELHKIGVYDLRGRRVRVIPVRPIEPDTMVTWDGRDDNGAVAPAGVYFLRLQSPAGSDVRRVTLLN